MAPARALLLAALATAIGVGVGVGIGAAIWEGDSSSAASPAGAESWLFVATARSGLVTATADDTLTILLRDAAPQALGFTDRPARQARAWRTPDLWAGLYANGSVPPNSALSFEHAGAAVLLPVEMLNVTGAAPNYTISARALGEGGVAHLGAALEQRPATVVRGARDPLWAELCAGLEVEAPAMFIDSFIEPPTPIDSFIDPPTPPDYMCRPCKPGTFCNPTTQRCDAADAFPSNNE